MPDIDNRKSMVSQETKFTSMIVNKIFGHRGFIHSPLFLSMIFLLFFFVLKVGGLDEYLSMLYGFTAGYLSHLVLDTMTRGGIPWLYPFSKKRFSLCKIKSGSVWEIFIAFILLIVMSICYLIFWYILK